MKGYLLVQSVVGMEKDSNDRLKRGYDKSDFLLDLNSSAEGLGFISLNAAIKQGKEIKVSAEKFKIYYEAQFLINPTSESSAGNCVIKGGPLACSGTIVNVQLNPNPHFNLGFICLSTSGNGKGMLRWTILIDEFVDAEKLVQTD